MRTAEQLANEYLSQRWHCEAIRFPAMPKDIPLALYLRVNLPIVLKSAIIMGRLMECDRQGKPLYED